MSLWFLALFAGLIVVAALVNQLAPVHRGRLRRAVILFAVALATFAISLALNEEWAERLDIASEIVRMFLIVNLGGLLLFLVLLPRVGLVLPVIAGELIAGVGYVVVLFVSLAHHDLDLTGAFATGAVLSAVLAISLQGTLGNILGGVALQLDGSIHEGDWLQFDNGRQGKIRAIRWRHTIVETRDWQTIVVPNAQLLANNITILGQRDGNKGPQRCWAYFHVDYRFTPFRVVKAVDDGLRGSPIDNVAELPQPSCLCLDFGKDHHESYANYGVQYWVNDMGRNDSTGSRVRMRIFAALQRAGIPLAIPARMEHLELHDDARKSRRNKREADAHFAAIKSVELLRMLDDSELRELSEGLTAKLWMAGEIITRQGATAHYLYILTSGSCEIRTKVDPDDDGPAPMLTRKVATIHAPDVFGEMGLVTGEPRTADVVAISDVECYRLDKQTFERVLLARPEIAVELSERLAEQRMELVAAREGLDDAARLARAASERAQILGGIRTFFGL